MSDKTTLDLETTGDFMLQDPQSGFVIEASGVTKDVPLTQFIKDRMDAGELVEAAPKKAAAPAKS